MKKQQKIWIAIPALNEAEWLPATIDAVRDQDYQNYEIVVCVNQPDEFSSSDKSEEKDIFDNNRLTLEYLQKQEDIPLHILDKSSLDKGWKDGKGSVGAARKYLMDYIAEQGNAEDIILSMDADTLFGSNYLASVNGIFTNHPDIKGLSNPYFHRLTGNEAVDRAMLRYEIYMRNYVLNLFRIGSPYCFTALGSAIATSVKSYRFAGGLTAKKSGEDFYFLQKLLKSGKLYLHNNEVVYPAARFSSRVFFGTGPAMIKGDKGNWESYPVYTFRLFDQVKETTDSFPLLWNQDISTPMDETLQADKTGLWKKLRQNASTRQQFIKACHQKVDGLRILQFLKSEQKKLPYMENNILLENLDQLGINVGSLATHCLHEHSILSRVSTSVLGEIRMRLFEKEIHFQELKPETSL